MRSCKCDILTSIPTSSYVAVAKDCLDKSLYIHLKSSFGSHITGSCIKWFEKTNILNHA